MDRRLEKLSDELIELGYDAGIALIVEEADFDDEPHKHGKVVFIMNEQSGQVGCIGVDVNDYPDKDICCFILELDQYKYFIQEGFEPEDIVTADGLENKVFRLVSIDELHDRLLYKNGN